NDRRIPMPRADTGGPVIDWTASQSFHFPPIPTDVYFGWGLLEALPERVRALGAKRVFLVTDPGIRKTGLVDRAVGLLSAGGIPSDIYDRVTPDSGSRLISDAAAQLRESGAGAVIGLGGGSSLDTAKAAAALATNPGSILDYVGLHRVKNAPLPVIAIPTTA